MPTEKRPHSIRRELIGFALIAFVMAPVVLIGFSTPLGWPGINIFLMAIWLIMLCAIGVAATWYANRRASTFEVSDGALVFRYSKVRRWASLCLFSGTLILLVAFQTVYGTQESAPYLFGFSAILALAAFVTKREGSRLRDVRVTPNALEVSTHDGTWEHVPWPSIREISIATPSQIAGPGIEMVTEKSQISVFRSIRGFRVFIAELRRQVAARGIPDRGVDWDNVCVFVEADRDGTTAS